MMSPAGVAGWPLSRIGRFAYCRRLATAGALLTCLAGVAQTQTLVQFKTCGPQTFPTATCTISATGGGNLIVVAWATILTNSSTTGIAISNVSDNANGAPDTFVQATAARATDGAKTTTEIWYALKGRGGATTLTITPNTSAGAIAMIWEFSSIASFDTGAALTSQAGTLTPSGAPVMVNSPNELVISVANAQGTISGLNASNTFVSDSTINGVSGAHLVAPSAGTFSALWDNTTAETYSSSTVAFKSTGLDGGGLTSSCDINQDGLVNVVDVQLITNMEINASGFTCSANVGGVLACSDAARQVVIKSALGQGCHFIYLTWTASLSAGVTGYNIYRSTAAKPTEWTLLNPGNPWPGTTYADLNTIPGSTYNYQITATDGLLESPPTSPPASATAQ